MPRRQINISLLLCCAIVLLLNTSAFAGEKPDIRQIISFIIKHNTEIAEMRKLNEGIFSDIKIEAYTRAGMASQDIGLTATMPLYSPKERRQRIIETGNKERELTLEASKFVGLYFSEMRHIENEEKLLKSLYNEVKWIGKRVEYGIDNQKEYNEKLHAYIERRRDIEARKAGAEALIESVIAFVSDRFKNELRRMISEALSEDKKAEGQDIPLHKEVPER